MAYSGGFILGCNSPGTGSNKTQYTSIFDAMAAAVDAHDHSSGKGTAIGTLGLANSAVTNAKIAASAVTSDKINDGAIITAKIAASGVTTAKIADGAVTLLKAATPNRVFGSVVAGYVTGNNPADEDVLDLAVTITPAFAGSRIRLRLANQGSALGPAFMSGTSVVLAVKDTTLGLDVDAVTFSGYMAPSAIVFEAYDPTLVAHTYQVRVVSAVGVVSFQSLRLVAEEIR